MPQRPVTDRPTTEPRPDRPAVPDRSRPVDQRISPTRALESPANPAGPASPGSPRPVPGRAHDQRPHDQRHDQRPQDRPGDPRPGDQRPHDQRSQNQRLSALIEEAGFSHAGLARRVDQLGIEHGLDLRYDKTSVTRWLRGQQPRGATPALIAEVFTRRLGRRLSAQDLGLDACAPVYAGLEFAESPAEAVDIVSSMWRKDTGAHSELRRIAFTPAGLVVPSRDWLIGRSDDRVARETSHDLGVAPPVRPLLRPGGPATAHPAGAVPPQSRRPPLPGTDPGPVTGQLPPPPPPRGLQRVGRGDVAAVRAVGDLFRSLDNAYGGGHARQALIRYLESEAEPMLRGRYNEAIGRSLFGAVADLTRLAGWTSYDIGAHGLAQRYFVQSLRLAQAANDRLYGGYVLVTMSRQAVYLGHGREAVQLARVAQQGVGAVAPTTVQALMHAAEARGHGLIGDTRSCTTSLVRAERALQAARPGDELPAWARFFDEAQLADEFCHCYRDLQQWRPCAQHAERSLRLRSSSYARSRVFCRTVLATARLGMGEVDEACTAATEALRGASEMRSLRAVEYLREFSRKLAPYRGNASVRAFEEAAHGAGVI